MSSIGGGLHDRHDDPEPDRQQVVPQSRIKAAQREWIFWASMLIALWTALQGNYMLVILFLMAAVLLGGGIFLYHQASAAIREAREKGIWR